MLTAYLKDIALLAIKRNDAELLELCKGLLVVVETEDHDDKMGFKNIKYFAYEIDKYAIKIANSNFPDIIQCGDAFDVRKDNWKIGGTDESRYF